jgi:nucleotide-binding universal stress UspA family protein
MRVKFAKILCTTDLSAASNHALDYAIALGRRFGSKLLVSNTVNLGAAVGLYDSSSFVLTTTRDELVNAARARIQETMASVKTAGEVAWEPLVLEGEAASEISRAAEEHGVDLVITATHGRTGLKRFLLGSVTERLLHTLAAPFLVVRSPEHAFVAAAGGDVNLRRILVGCDFSPDAEVALQYGISLAQEFEAELHLLHVLEPTVYRHLGMATASLADDLEGAVRGVVERKLAELVPRHQYPWCVTRPAFASGAAHEGIVQHAVANAIDLIIVGVRGHNLLERILVGSTTDRVLRAAPCPVLAVRAPAAAPPAREG